MKANLSNLQNADQQLIYNNQTINHQNQQKVNQNKYNFSQPLTKISSQPKLSQQSTEISYQRKLRQTTAILYQPIKTDVSKNNLNTQIQQQLKKRNNKCSLCSVPGRPHITKECPFSTDLFYITSLQKIPALLKQGITAQKRQLGRAIYVSDNAITVIKYFHRHKQQQLKEPTLLKLKANATRILQINNPKQVLKLDKQKLARDQIQCIKYPIYKLNGNKLYQWAMFKCDYAVVAFSPINLPKNPQKAQTQKLPDYQKQQLIAQITNKSQVYKQMNQMLQQKKTPQQKLDEKNNSYQSLNIVHKNKQTQDNKYNKQFITNQDQVKQQQKEKQQQFSDAYYIEKCNKRDIRQNQKQENYKQQVFNQCYQKKPIDKYDSQYSVNQRHDFQKQFFNNTNQEQSIFNKLGKQSIFKETEYGNNKYNNNEQFQRLDQKTSKQFHYNKNCKTQNHNKHYEKQVYKWPVNKLIWYSMHANQDIKMKNDKKQMQTLITPKQIQNKNNQQGNSKGNVDLQDRMNNIYGINKSNTHTPGQQQ